MLFSESDRQKQVVQFTTKHTPQIQRKKKQSHFELHAFFAFSIQSAEETEQLQKTCINEQAKFKNSIAVSDRTVFDQLLK